MTSRMNQEKIGKLIAKLRKQKDLTQRELGEKVGVGYRAVSKWETGQTMPDISIINELSTILGISSDELLKGELNPKDDIPTPTIDIDSKSKNNNKKRKLLLLIPLLLIIAIIVILIVNNSQKPTEYTIKSLNPKEYILEGELLVKDKDIIIEISNIEFQNYLFFQKPIKNYEFRVDINNNIIFGYGSSKEYNNIENNITINSFFNNFSVNYHDEMKYNIKDIDEKKLVILFKFTDINNNTIEKAVEAILVKKNNI